MECETPTQPPIVIEVAPEPMKSTPAIESTANENDVEDSAVPSDFVNRGLNHWTEVREQWNACSKTDTTQRSAISVDVDEIIDLIFSQRWKSPDDDNGAFPQAVPLPQMVDILVDLWEAEGLDI